MAQNKRLLGLLDANENTVLHYAAKFGRVLIVQEILSLRLSVTRSNRDGFTAAHLAAACGSLEIIQALHNAGDSLCTPNNVMWTPLHYALKYKHRDVVSYLLRNNCALVENDHIATSIAQMAVVENDKVLLQMFLESGFDIGMVNHVGWNLVHFAAANGNETVMELMQDMITEEHLLAKDIYRRTPFMQAVIGRHMSMVMKLEQFELDMYSAVDKFGKNSLHYAVQLGYMEMVEHLLEKIDIDEQDARGMSPLHLAALYGRIDVMQFLLDSHAKTDLTDKMGRTPLYVACENAKPDAMALLLQHGARYDILPSNQRSLISCAVITQDPATFEFVLGIPKIPIFAPDVNEWTPVHYAAQLGRVNFLEKLAGIDSSALLHRDNKGRTPFHTAATWEQLDVIMFYLQIEGFDPNIVDSKGETALHLAIRQNSASIVCRLADCDQVDMNIKNCLGDAPIHLAVEMWEQGIISVLCACERCDLNIEDSDGMTPILLSAELGQSTIVEILTKSRRLDCLAVDRHQNGAAHFAALLRTPGTLKVLYQLGQFRLFEKNDRGETPFDMARRHDNHEIMCFLEDLESSEPEPNDMGEDDSIVSPTDQKLWKAMPKRGTLYDSSVYDDTESQENAASGSSCEEEEEYELVEAKEEEEMSSFLEIERAANEEEEKREEGSL